MAIKGYLLLEMMGFKITSVYLKTSVTVCADCSAVDKSQHEYLWVHGQQSCGDIQPWHKPCRTQVATTNSDRANKPPELLVLYKACSNGIPTMDFGMDWTNSVSSLMTVQLSNTKYKDENNKHGIFTPAMRIKEDRTKLIATRNATRSRLHRGLYKMGDTAPKRSKARPLNLSQQRHVISAPMDGTWMSYPPSTRVTIYNTAEQKLIIKRIRPFGTIKDIVLLITEEVFEREVLAEFTLKFKSWTPSGHTEYTSVHLHQTLAEFHSVLDLVVVQFNPLDSDWTWFMSENHILQEREPIQTVPASSPMQMMEQCTSASGGGFFSDSAFFTLQPARSQLISRLFSVVTQPEDAGGQSAAPGNTLQITYTDRGDILSTPLAEEVRVNLFTEERQGLLTTLVMGEMKFEEVAKVNSDQICGALRTTHFTFKTASSTGPNFFLKSNIMVGGFGAEINITAVKADIGNWFWRVGNTGYLERRTYYG